MGNHLGTKGRANFPKLPQRSTTENSMAESGKATDGRAQSRTLTWVTDRRTDGRTCRRAKRAADYSVAHDIPAAGIAIVRIARSRKTGLLSIVAAIGPTVGIAIVRIAPRSRIMGLQSIVVAIGPMVRRPGSQIIVNILLHINIRTLMRANSLTVVCMAVTSIGAIVAVVGYGPTTFIHCIIICVRAPWVCLCK